MNMDMDVMNAVDLLRQMDDELDRLDLKWGLEVTNQHLARQLLAEIDALRDQRAALVATLPFYTYTVHVIIDRGVARDSADACDLVSSLLTDNADIFDWAYVRDDEGRYAYARPVPTELSSALPAEDEADVSHIAANTPWQKPADGRGVE